MSIRRQLRHVFFIGVSVFAAGLAKAEDVAPEIIDMVSHVEADSLRYRTLTMADYQAVARQLDVPVAAIRAVVSIEAGPQAEGFNPDNTPLINFDVTMFRKYAKIHKLDLSKYRSSHAVVFAAPNIRKYGSYQAAQYARLNAAMSIDTVCALESVFWGMFQIGGFNWKICGCGSVREFVHQMSYSERSQLELFAKFIKATHLDVYLRKRDWAGFSLRYNGPSYKKRGYDTKMAAAYAKYSK